METRCCKEFSLQKRGVRIWNQGLRGVAGKEIVPQGKQGQRGRVFILLFASCLVWRRCIERDPGGLASPLYTFNLIRHTDREDEKQLTEINVPAILERSAGACRNLNSSIGKILPLRSTKIPVIPRSLKPRRLIRSRDMKLFIVSEATVGVRQYVVTSVHWHRL